MESQRSRGQNRGGGNVDHRTADKEVTEVKGRTQGSDRTPARKATTSPKATASRSGARTARQSGDTDGTAPSKKSRTAPAGSKPGAPVSPSPSMPADPAASAAPKRTARKKSAEPQPTPRDLAAETIARALRPAVRRTRAEEAAETPSIHSSQPNPGGSTVSPPDYPAFFGDLDLYLAGEGQHFRLWEKLGAHPIEVDGVAGVVFAVWAPNAEGVSVIGDFNQWDGRLHPTRPLGRSGIWYAFIPGLKQGDLYKYEIRTREGHLRIKSDPLAFYSELRPHSASRVWDVTQYGWNDQEWMDSRRNRDWRREPMNIYEVHLASWMRAPEDDNRWLTYRELAPRLVDHLKRYNFTHVELLPVAEHLLDQSWGYQVTGYFAPTSRHGNPDDFKFLIDLLHQNGIGVIIDWVPAHFPKDDTGLRWFDGTALYEHADPRKGEHTEWGTLIFNYGRHEVRNFLLANALFWLDVYHIDGLRVDAVASMLYLDYSRKDGEWLPNQYGGKENLEAIDLLRKMNELVYGLYPGAFTVAEESTDWGGVTMPTYLGGLGFGFKWDMGWMHDTLLYFSKDPVHRRYHHNDLTFAMLYAYTENFIMPLSHDEVVHGKGSLLQKMAGDEWQRFANLRSMYAYMFTRPGKKLFFMGAEFAQGFEWYSDASLHWHMSEFPAHKGIETLMADLGRIYRENDCLWHWDAEPQGYQWIDCSDAESSVVSYLRRGPNGWMLVAMNLTPVPRSGYRIGVPEPGYYREVINTDSEIYGGTNLGNGGGLMAEEVGMHGQAWSLNLVLPPLAAVVFQPAR